MPHSGLPQDEPGSADSGRELWEFVSGSMPPLRAWLAEQSDETRARAEQVYLEYLAPGVLRREPGRSASISTRSRRVSSHAPTSSC